VLAQQNPAAIDAGVFHNDVISVGNLNVFLHHRSAFLDTGRVVLEVAEKWSALTAAPLIPIPVELTAVSLEDAVGSYLFNSQLVSRPDGRMSLIAPSEARENERTRRAIEAVIATGGPVDSVEYFELRESMRNGGGPACLRLRVVLTAEERAAASGRVMLDRALHEELVAWVERRYRDRLETKDLSDPKLLDESRTALDELSQILRLGSIYDFQA
jgi:succinylarginine dihydrolase